MPRAEKGTPKAIANQQKSKGLQRLRWYCQVCEKQCRDENGFKCHVQSEAHVRQMLIVGQNPARYVSNFSRQFMGDFLQLLRTTHGEKRIHANHFYASQYIANKNHVHMNSTRWKTLTEFITFLGHEGICKVEDTDKGWFISWIDNSPEALKKRDANLKRERLEKGEADREDRLMQEQIERAKQDAIEKEMVESAMSVKEEISSRRNLLSLNSKWRKMSRQKWKTLNLQRKNQLLRLRLLLKSHSSQIPLHSRNPITPLKLPTLSPQKSLITRSNRQ